MRGVVPRSLPVYVLADRGLWAAWLFRAIQRNGWHPLLRVNAQGRFRARWQRQAQPLTAFCPERGTQRAVEGYAFAYGLRCTLVVYWGARAQEPWYLLTDVPASVVDGAWYGLRSWIEQGFRHLKRGGWGWHRSRVVASARVFLDWLVYALGQLLVVWFGVWGSSSLRLWDVSRRSVGERLLGLCLLLGWLLGLWEWDVGENWGFWEGGELK